MAGQNVAGMESTRLSSFAHAQDDIGRRFILLESIIIHRTQT